MNDYLTKIIYKNDGYILYQDGSYTFSDDYYVGKIDFHKMKEHFFRMKGLFPQFFGTDREDVILCPICLTDTESDEDNKYYCELCK
jgi:hypothetical protein